MPIKNYKQEKRQKDIQKKKKRDEKINRRQSKKPAEPIVNPTPVEEKEKEPGA